RARTFQGGGQAAGPHAARRPRLSAYAPRSRPAESDRPGQLNLRVAMTEPSDLTAPKDPADYRPRPLLGVTFWAMIAFAVVCVLAGVAIADFGPRLFERRPPVRPPEAVQPVEPAPATGTAAVSPPA